MIYVDSMFMPATVGRIRARWCHMMSDQIDPEELHLFAESIGMKRAWFQQSRTFGNETEPNPVGDHYDVTEGRRAAAVAKGAVELDRDGFVELMKRRRALIKAAREEKT